MNSEAYTAMKTEMEKGTYTEVEAKKTVTTLYVQKMLTEDEYSKLMDMANELNPNTNDGEIRNAIAALNEKVDANIKMVDIIREKLDEKGIDISVPEISNDGSMLNPITAKRGMIYYPGKYYKDPEDDKIYMCRNDREDVNAIDGVRLDYIPSELLNIYFILVK